MSELQARLRAWHERGYLRYLAHQHGVTIKQVTRYWDNGLVEGGYCTPKDHRRIHYTDSTVENVALLVRLAKERNLRIRYHIRQIDYLGTIIPVKGCNSMHDLFQRALKMGLSRQAAHKVAYTTHSHPSPSPQEIAWDTLLALKCTYEEEVAESIREFGPCPLSFLLGASDTKDFRARARKAWREILSYYKSEEEWCPVSLAAPETVIRKQRTKKIFRKILSQPDLASFISTWSEESELQHRVLKTDAETYEKVHQQAEENPGAIRLNTAAVTLKRKQHTPSARALAGVLGMSRPALYRAFGAEAVQAALKLVR